VVGHLPLGALPTALVRTGQIHLVPALYEAHPEHAVDVAIYQMQVRTLRRHNQGNLLVHEALLSQSKVALLVALEMLLHNQLEVDPPVDVDALTLLDRLDVLFLAIAVDLGL